MQVIPSLELYQFKAAFEELRDAWATLNCTGEPILRPVLSKFAKCRMMSRSERRSCILKLGQLSKSPKEVAKIQVCYKGLISFWKNAWSSKLYQLLQLQVVWIEVVCLAQVTVH